MSDASAPPFGVCRRCGRGIWHEQMSAAKYRTARGLHTGCWLDVCEEARVADRGHGDRVLAAVFIGYFGGIALSGLIVLVMWLWTVVL
jgi:hypothetical protein